MLFKLDISGSTPRQEIRAGVTTFMTMAYIIVVHTHILADAGMPRDGVMVATCLAQDQVTYQIDGDAELSLHLMLPADSRATAVRVGGAPISFANALVEQTPYADAMLTVSGCAEISVHLEAAFA